jgi:DNA-binding NarL/FixJ family response regulator
VEDVVYTTNAKQLRAGRRAHVSARLCHTLDHQLQGDVQDLAADGIRKYPGERSTTYRFEILSGQPALTEAMTQQLEASALQRETHAATILLLDMPSGFAWRQLRRIDTSSHDIVVVTGNTCPEYLEDLWDLRPAILYAGTWTMSIAELVVRASEGERMRLTPEQPLRLTPNERAVLGAIAHGWPVKRIAAYFEINEQSVRNTTWQVYKKLRLAGRVEATLYYWGVLET